MERDTSQPTRAQRRILDLLLAGKTNKEIAFELGLAQSTVRVQVMLVCRKHKVYTRAELLEKLLPPAASRGA